MKIIHFLPGFCARVCGCVCVCVCGCVFVMKVSIEHPKTSRSKVQHECMYMCACAAVRSVRHCITMVICCLFSSSFKSVLC